MLVFIDLPMFFFLNQFSRGKNHRFETTVFRFALQVLTFSGEITTELLDGDAITLDESSILLNSRRPG
jgi:hypothetical protein